MFQRTSLAALRRSFTFLTISAALFACSNGNDEVPNDSIEGNSLLLNFTSDYTTGELRWMDPDSTGLSQGSLDYIPDSRLSTGGGVVFILGSAPGTLGCISPENMADIKEERLSAEYPYEATVIGGKGYIALHDADYLQIFDASTCAQGGKIDLPVSNANASSIKSSGDTLLVVLQRLEFFDATKPGLLVRINATTETLIDTIPLNLHNPHSSVLSKGKLYISAQARYNEDYSYNYANSGIEVVDLTRGIAEVLLTGEQIGGGVYGMALDEASQTLYAGVSASWGDMPVKPVNLNSKSAGAALPNITDSEGGLVFDNLAKKLFVGDRSYGDGGLKAYNPAVNQTTAVNGEALPPYSLAIVRW